MKDLEEIFDALGRIEWILMLLKNSGSIKTKKTKEEFRITLSFRYREWLLAFVAWLF